MTDARALVGKIVKDERGCSLVVQSYGGGGLEGQVNVTYVGSTGGFWRPAEGLTVVGDTTDAREVAGAREIADKHGAGWLEKYRKNLASDIARYGAARYAEGVRKTLEAVASTIASPAIVALAQETRDAAYAEGVAAGREASARVDGSRSLHP